SDEPPPRLTKKGAAKPDAAPAASGGTGSSPGAQPSAGSGSAEKPGATTPATAPASQTPPGTAAGTSSGQEAQKSTAPAAGGSSPDAAAADKVSAQAQTPPKESTESYYRPSLRRGKPTQAAPTDPEPERKASAPTERKTDSAGGAGNAGSGEAVQLVPAISDAGGPDPKSYKFYWKTGEEEEKRNLMLGLAGQEVRAYSVAEARNQIPAKPAAVKPTAAGRKKQAKPIEPVFENLQFRAYDVWGNNQPVMILTAEAHFPPAAGDSTAPKSYSIALIARTDIYGDLRKLYSGVTDMFHLDVTPRLDLIDVVDADGDGRGELLFHETSDAGSGYVIYRATADKLWKLFDSLNAE